MSGSPTSVPPASAESMRRLAGSSRRFRSGVDRSTSPSAATTCGCRRRRDGSFASIPTPARSSTQTSASRLRARSTWVWAACQRRPRLRLDLGHELAGRHGLAAGSALPGGGRGDPRGRPSRGSLRRGWRGLGGEPRGRHGLSDRCRDQPCGEDDPSRRAAASPQGHWVGGLGPELRRRNPDHHQLEHEPGDRRAGSDRTLGRAGWRRLRCHLGDERHGGHDHAGRARAG